MSVSGFSTLSPGITKYGYKGVGLVLPVAVTTTSDSSCPKGTKGTITYWQQVVKLTIRSGSGKTTTKTVTAVMRVEHGSWRFVTA